MGKCLNWIGGDGGDLGSNWKMSISTNSKVSGALKSFLCLVFCPERRNQIHTMHSIFVAHFYVQMFSADLKKISVQY